MVDAADYALITDGMKKRKWKSIYAFVKEAVSEKLIKDGMKSENTDN